MKDGRHLFKNNTKTRKLQKHCRNKGLVVYWDGECENWLIYLKGNLFVELLTGQKLDFGRIQNALGKTFHGGLRDDEAKVKTLKEVRKNSFASEREDMSKDLGADLYYSHGPGSRVGFTKERQE